MKNIINNLFRPGLNLTRTLLTVMLIACLAALVVTLNKPALEVSPVEKIVENYADNSHVPVPQTGVLASAVVADKPVATISPAPDPVVTNVPNSAPAILVQSEQQKITTLIISRNAQPQSSTNTPRKSGDSFISSSWLAKAKVIDMDSFAGQSMVRQKGYNSPSEMNTIETAKEKLPEVIAQIKIEDKGVISSVSSPNIDGINRIINSNILLNTEEKKTNIAFERCKYGCETEKTNCSNACDTNYGSCQTNTVDINHTDSSSTSGIGYFDANSMNNGAINSNRSASNNGYHLGASNNCPLGSVYTCRSGCIDIHTACYKTCKPQMTN